MYEKNIDLKLMVANIFSFRWTCVFFFTFYAVYYAAFYCGTRVFISSLTESLLKWLVQLRWLLELPAKEEVTLPPPQLPGCVLRNCNSCDCFGRLCTFSIPLLRKLNVALSVPWAKVKCQRVLFSCTQFTSSFRRRAYGGKRMHLPVHSIKDETWQSFDFFPRHWQYVPNKFDRSQAFH